MDEIELEECAVERKTNLEKNKVMGINRNLFGQMLAFLYSLSFSTSIVLFKKTNLLTTNEQLTFRYIFHIIIMTLIAKCNGIQLFGFKNELKLMSIRVFMGVSIQMLNFTALFLLTNPSDLIAITHSSIIVIAVLSRFIFNEKLSIVHIISIIVAVIGINLISKPKFIFGRIDSAKNMTIVEDSQLKENIGYFLSGIIAILAALIKIVIKKLAHLKVHFSIHTLYIGLVGLPLNLTISLLMIYFGKSDLFQNFTNRFEEMKLNILYLVLTSVLTAINNSLMTLSLQYEDATKVSIINTFELFMTFIIQYILLNISTDWIKICGSCMIIFSGINILLFKIFDDRHSKKKIEMKRNENNENTFKKLIFYKI